MLYSATCFTGGAVLGVAGMWCSMGWSSALHGYGRLQVLKKVSVLALVLALLLSGVDDSRYRTGAQRARRWFQLPGTTFQPSEFAKLAVSCAGPYCERKGRGMGTFKYGLLIPGMVLTFFPLGLIFIEPDWGATVLLATVCGMMCSWPEQATIHGSPVMCWERPVVSCCRKTRFG
ncbi:MAG: hypothetical protein CM1200mP29_10160 [Verrucomicrobiota bacterium]|nr:MAG: hypothetical protein CM1200mP29_10160 [Verrucomicrobiota bacterium]